MIYDYIPFALFTFSTIITTLPPSFPLISTFKLLLSTFLSPVSQSLLFVLLGKPVTITKHAVTLGNTSQLINVPNQNVQKQVMIGRKPITVQMPAGNQRTLLLNQVPGTIAGKIVCLPNSTVATNISTEQPKLMVVSRPKQPSATIASASFDSPATTDAALAALAAETGLIDPEPAAKFEDGPDAYADSGVGLPNSQESAVETAEDMLASSQDTQMEEDGAAEKLEPVPDDVEMKDLELEPVQDAAEATNSEPFVGEKLGLKGGGRIRLGLLGGGLAMPPRSFKWKQGLLGGGNNDQVVTDPAPETESTSPTAVNSMDTDIASTCTTTTATTPVVSTTEMSMEVENDSSFPPLDMKDALDEEESNFQLRLSNQSNDDTLKADELNQTDEIIKEEFEEKMKQVVEANGDKAGAETSANEQTEQKNDEQIGDALSTLASAALGRATPQVYAQVCSFRHFGKPFKPSGLFFPRSRRRMRKTKRTNGTRWVS